MKKRYGKKFFILAFWLAAWQAASLFLDNPLVFVSPLQVAEALVKLPGDPDFWRILGTSLGKIGGGFLLALAAGLLLGGAAYRLPFLGELVSPVLSLMKTVPVASFVILALILMGSANLSILIVFVVTLPVIALQTQAGLANVDPQLLEMAQVFRIRGWKRFWNLYRPAMAPFLLSALRLTVGMGWKSGVAAEVIGVSRYSIGAELYNAKIYLQTENLFAWTAIILLLSFLCEKAVMWAAGRLLREG